MKMLIVIFIVLIVMWIIDLIRWFIARKEAKRAAIRADFRHAEVLDAWARLESSVKSLRVNEIEYNSIKRHIRVLLDKLEK